ncbi:hypothetical protein ACF0H5_000916 [Mactra antiquata]
MLFRISFHNCIDKLIKMKIICFILLSVYIGTTYASQCCFPRQYEANQGIAKATARNGQLSIMTGNIHYWFDAVSRRERFNEYIVIDDIPYNIVVIKDYNMTNTKYVITNGHCTKSSLTKFKEGCIQDSSTELISSSYGLQDSGRDFTIYNNTAGIVTSFLIATNDCLPMLDVSIVPRGTTPYMEVVNFYNFTTGIKDPTVFDIPSLCKPPSPVG